MPLVYMDSTRGGRPFNVLRKAWHLLGLVIPWALYADLFAAWGPLATRRILLCALVVFWILLVLTDLLRFRSDAFSAFYRRMFSALMKEGEHQSFNASVPYIGANIVLFLFCSTEIAVVAALFLNIGDAAASLFGAWFGRLRLWNGRSLVGAVAFVFWGSAAALGFLAVHSQLSEGGGGATVSLLSATGIAWGVVGMVVVGATFAACAELFSATALWGLVDDNLWVPPAGLLGMTLVALALGLDAGQLFFDPRGLF